MGESIRSFGVIIHSEVCPMSVCEKRIRMISRHAEKTCERAIETPSMILSFPDSVEVIGAYAFAGCKGLKEVKLPSGVKRIEYGAFSDMNISEIVVPKSVDYIGNEAFEGIENVVKR